MASPMRASRDARSSRNHISVDKLSVLTSFVQQTNSMVEEAKASEAARIASESASANDARLKPDRPFSLAASLGTWPPPPPHPATTTASNTNRATGNHASPFRQSMDSAAGKPRTPITHPLQQSWDLGSDPARNSAANAQAVLRMSLAMDSTADMGRRSTSSYTASPMQQRQQSASGSRTPVAAGALAAADLSRPGTTRSGAASPANPVRASVNSGSASPASYLNSKYPVPLPLASQANGASATGSPRAAAGGAASRSRLNGFGDRSGSVPGAIGGSTGIDNDLSYHPHLDARSRMNGGLADRSESVPGALPGGTCGGGVEGSSSSAVALQAFSLGALEAESAEPRTRSMPAGPHPPPQQLTPRPPPADVSLHDLAAANGSSDGQRRSMGSRIGRPTRYLSDTGVASPAPPPELRQGSLTPAPPAPASRQGSVQRQGSMARQGSVRKQASQSLDGAAGDRPGTAAAAGGNAACPWDPQNNPMGHFIDEALLGEGGLLAGDGGWKKLNFSTTGSVMARMQGMTERSHAAAQEGRTTQKAALQTKGVALADNCSGDSSALRFQTVAGAVVNSWSNGSDASGMGPMGSAMNGTCLPASTIKSKYQFRSNTASGAASPLPATPGGGARASGASTPRQQPQPPQEPLVPEAAGGAASPQGSGTTPQDNGMGGKKFSFSDLVYQATGLNKKGMGRGFRKDITESPDSGAASPVNKAVQAAASTAAKWLASARASQSGSAIPSGANMPVGMSVSSSLPVFPTGLDLRPTTAAVAAAAAAAPAAAPAAPAAFQGIAHYKALEEQERQAAAATAAATAAAAAKDNPLSGLAAAAAILRAQGAAAAGRSVTPEPERSSAGNPSPFSLQQALASGAGASGGNKKEKEIVLTTRRSQSYTGDSTPSKDTHVINTEVLAAEFANLRAVLGEGSWPHVPMSRASQRDPVESARMRAGQQQRDKQFRTSANRVKPLLD